MKLKESLAVMIAALLVPLCSAGAQTTPYVFNSDSGNIVVVTLHDGDDLIPKLSEVVDNHGIRSGLILATSGALRNFTLGYYDISLRRYYKKTYAGPYDIAAAKGIIAHSKNGSLNMDIVTYCDSTNTDLHASDVIFATVGGHLFAGTVSNSCVIVIKRLDTVKLVRDYHPENGTWDFYSELVIPGASLPKDYASSGVNWLQDYRKAVNGRTDLFGANSNAPVYDVAGRRINRLRNGRLEKAASGMYLVPQRAGKTGTIIKK